MKEINLRKKKFYNSVLRSFIWLVVLLILLAITDVNIAKALLTLLIVGILLNFAYVAETQLPFITAKVPQSGLVISSAVHIGVIFITYIYLLEVATENNNVKQVFNVVFLLLLCIPLFRGGKALYEGIDSFANQAVKVFDESKPSIKNTSQFIVCKNCSTENDISAKHCIECGHSLQEPKIIQQFILCPQCGTENNLNAKHCVECGTYLTRTITKKEPAQVRISGENKPSVVAGGNIKDRDRKEFRFSVAHPLTFSKRFESVILCQIYLPESRSRALRNIKFEFHEQPYDEKTKTSLIKLGQKITVKLDGSNFSFSEPVTKTINDSVGKFAFIAKPNDNCEPDYHKIKASVIDTITGEEFDYLILNHVRVVDFAFDHISRPLLSRVSAIVLGIGSFAMFILTFLEQIDKTIGLTSGTAAGVLAIGIYVSFYNLYQRVYPNTP